MLPLSHLYHRTPLIFGHRGAAAHAPENTLPAFERALELGADGIELDVALSADGVPVVIHDDTLDRTTNGTGPVGACRLAELAALEAGYPARFGARFAGTRLPTLEDVFAQFGQQAVINVELKRAHARAQALAEAVVALIDRYGLQARVIVSSFQLSHLRRVRALRPGLAIGVLYNTRAAGERAQRALTAALAPGRPPEADHPAVWGLTPEAVAARHARGCRVNTWTVNHAADLRSLAAAGVDGVITDDPRIARE